MTNLEREYLISLRESDQLAAGPELEKASELDNEATLEKAPSELTSSIDNADVYGDDEEFAEDVGEVVVECYNFLMESSDEEFNNFVETLTESEIDFCLDLLDGAYSLNEGKKIDMVKKAAPAALGAVAAHTAKSLGTKAAAAGTLGSSLAGIGTGIGGAVLGAAAAYGAKKLKHEIDARKKAGKYYDGSKDLVIGKDGDGKDIRDKYEYSTRKQDRKTALLQNKLKHNEKVTAAKLGLKHAKQDGDEEGIRQARLEKKKALRARATDAARIKNEAKLKAKIARSTARADEARVRAGHAEKLKLSTDTKPGDDKKEPVTESFSDLDLMYMLEDAGYDATLDNLILLKEGFETGEWTVIYECNYTDYELCKILDENGYAVTDSNVEILREGFINGTYTI